MLSYRSPHNRNPFEHRRLHSRFLLAPFTARISCGAPFELRSILTPRDDGSIFRVLVEGFLRRLRPIILPSAISFLRTSGVFLTRFLRHLSCTYFLIGWNTSQCRTHMLYRIIVKVTYYVV